MQSLLCLPNDKKLERPQQFLSQHADPDPIIKETLCNGSGSTCQLQFFSLGDTKVIASRVIFVGSLKFLMILKAEVA